MDNYENFYRQIFEDICKNMGVPHELMYIDYRFEPPITVGKDPVIKLNWYRIKQYQYPGCKALYDINNELWKLSVQKQFGESYLLKFLEQNKRS